MHSMSRKKRNKKKHRGTRALVIIMIMVICCGFGAHHYLAGDGAPWFAYTYNESENALVRTAASQLGNQGGEKFWSWYGYDSHVDWCACFVSWCASKNGYTGSGKVPKFSYVPTGISWFQSKGLYQDSDYTPEPGDIIFFDFTQNGTGDHVGIVAGTYFGLIFTIEGNNGDACRARIYLASNKNILGYGQVNE